MDPKTAMVDMSKLQGFKEYARALKILSGEEVLTEQQTQQKQSQPVANDQIDSRQANTFDQIDPLFTQALNAPSIQAIKENDKLIKQIQMQSSL